MIQSRLIDGIRSLLRSRSRAAKAARPLCTVAIFTLTICGTVKAGTSSVSKGIILELGSSIEYILVTPEYSNAVLVALLPYISEVAQRLDLPLPNPVTGKDVSYCSVLPKQKVEAEIGLTAGWVFTFNRGYVETVQAPRHFFGLRDLDRIPEFFGPVRMSKAEGIQLARDTLRKLGVKLECVFAEQKPRVTGPLPNGTNTIPHYRIEWLDPRYDGQAPGCVTIDIDAQVKRVERIYLNSKAMERPPPEVEVVPPRDPRFPVWPQVNPDYAWRLLPIALTAVEDYGRKLALRLPRPLTTNHVARFSVADNGGWPHSEIELTNGWRFIYRNSMVNGFYAPDNFFNSDKRPILIRDFRGEWRMTESEAQDLVRRTLAKLNYPTNRVHFEVKPQVHKPGVPGIPRYQFYWYYSREDGDDLQSIIWAEVDADRGRLTSLYYDEKSYWNHPPLIDVPISLPVHTRTATPQGKASNAPTNQLRSHHRLEVPVPIPR
jgi:hypothetical protein